MSTYVPMERELYTRVRTVDPVVAVGAWVYAFLCMIILVGPAPLEGSLPGGDIGEDGGSIARQIVLLGLMSLGVGLGMRRGGVTAVGMPVPFFVFFVWAALSVMWSVAPEIAIRRLVMSVGSTLAVFSLVRLIGPAAVLRITSRTLLVIVILDLLAVALFSNAVHGAGELDQQLIGFWKGLHAHKNIASSVAFAGLVMGLINIDGRNKYQRYALIVLSAILLFGSSSKTTLYLLPAIASLIYVAILTSRSAIRRWFTLLGLLYISILLCILILNYWDYIELYFTDPRSFTGRVAIWQVMIKYIEVNPLGSGFLTFWNIGSVTPALGLAPLSIAMVPHGHNGYLEILVTTGYPGLLIAAYALLVWPLRKFVAAYKLGGPLFLFSIALYGYCIVANITESSFFFGGRVNWLFLSIALALIHTKEAHEKFMVESPMRRK